MSVEPANNDPLVVGSVRRLAGDERGVTLLVEGSRNALAGAAIFALVPIACVTMGVYYCVTSFPDLRSPNWLGLLIGFTIVALGVMLLPSAVVLPMIRRLLGTALSRVTLDADAAQLRLLAFGVGRPVCLTWRRDAIRDVCVRTRGAGIYQLHIVPAAGPPVSILYGVARDELEFIADELRRALQIDARPGSVAGWWGDGAEESPADSSAGAVLDYAPEPKEHAAAQRSAFRARVFIPPARVAAVVRQRKWSLATTVVLVAIVLLAFQPAGWLWVAYAAIVFTTELPAFLECVRHRSVEVDAERVTLTVRTMLLGERVCSWPAETVADIAADRTELQIHFRDGTREVVATLTTPAAADALAQALRPAAPA